MNLPLPYLYQKAGFALHVSRDGAALWHARLASSPLFATAPEQATAMGQLLLAHPKELVTLIADDAAQEIRLDNIPLLKGLDRRRLIVRRVQSLYPNEPFAACIAGQRQDAQERLCILHLPHDGETARWLRWLSALPNPPGGTIATTKIAAALLEQLASGEETPEWMHGCFVTEAGLRQVSLHQGIPVLSRLIPLVEPRAATLPTALAHAVSTAQQYLARYGWRDEQNEQSVAIVPPALLESIKPQSPPGMLLLTPAEAGRWVNLAAPTPTWETLCALIAQRERRSLFPHLLPHQRERLEQSRLAQLGWGAAAGLLLFAGLTTAMSLWSWQSARQQLAMAEQEGRGIQQAVLQSRGQMGDVAIARTRLRQARLLQQDMRAPTPWPLLLAVGKALPPPVRMLGLEWAPRSDGQGVSALLRLRIVAGDDNKDAVQQAALKEYATFTQALQEALPQATLKTKQAPYALGSNQLFNDPAMLQTAAVGEASAQLEISLP